MTMNARKTILATLLATLAVTPLAVAPVHARAQTQAAHVYTQAELDQMLAPIALYPDALLSQVLMASTYPIEVVEAARWMRANPGLQGDDAVRGVQDEDWDPSVKSLVAFPQILQRMDEKLEWTRSLGDAFLAQEPQMMDQVQQLRRRAQAAGSLRSDERVRVEQQGPTIVVRPASPQYVYVPYYDPLIVYGPWWWPAYRPVVVNRTVAATPHRWQHQPRRLEAVSRRRPVQIKQHVQAQPAPPVLLRPQVRHEQRARMPAAVAPQLPRAERREQRKERRETRQEQRQERGQKG